ncbi:MAG: S9 family peptidase [Roseiflexaceae bacterium]|nr:S9 family peptidase [Roseiflexaceae bacterium]
MRSITPEDVLGFSSLLDLQLSPDGTLAAFVRSDAYKEYRDFTRSHIWIVPTGAGEARQFTSGARADWAPRWSPDGRTLAFLSDRVGERTQVFLLPRDGGEARQLTALSGEIDELAWSPDGSQLAFLMTDPAPVELAARRERGDDAQEFERHHAWQRVWTADLASGATRQVTSGDVHVWEFGWAPDGGFALLTSSEPYEWSWFDAAIAYVGPEGGLPRTIHRAPEKCYAMPRSPDGKTVTFLSGIWSDRGINAGELLLAPLAGNDGEPPVSLSSGYAGSIWWYRHSPDGATVDFLAYEQGQAAVGRIDRASGERATRWRGEVAFNESHAAAHLAMDGTLAVIRADARTAQELYVAAPTDALEFRQLTHLHSELAGELAIGETRTICWNSTDGRAMQGLLILPVGYASGQPVPLVAWVHGGPAWLYTHTYYVASRGLQLLAGKGMAVFLPNPRGSNGWGLPFLESNIGDFGGMDYQDIISGVDHLIAAGIADGERLGIGGWSYGGFMAAWAIGQTQRFKAALVGAAIVNWRSFHGAAEIGLWDRVAMRANPYRQGGIYDQRSPISAVERVSTPTLILHGEHDRVVPLDQGYEFFRALKDHGVPVELVSYPREGHSISERLHQLDRMRRWLALFEQHLIG